MSKKNKKLEKNDTPTAEPTSASEPEIIDLYEDFPILGPDDPHPKYGPWKSHTICVQESTLARLNALAEDHPDLRRKIITDAVISRGLKKYGY